MRVLLLTLESGVRIIWINGYAVQWSLVYPHAYFSDRSNIQNRSWSCWLYVIWCYLKNSSGELCERCVGVKCNTQPSNSWKLLSPPLNRALTQYHSRVILLHSHAWSAVHEINLLSTMACNYVSIVACMGLQPQIQVNCNIIYERRWKLLTRGGVRYHVRTWDVSFIMMVVLFILVFIWLRSTEQGLDSETSN